MTRQGNGCGFHYGLEFVLSHSTEEIEETARRLERKQNRRAKQERNEKKSVHKLNEELRLDLARGFAGRVESHLTELNRRFRKMYNLRMKG